MADTTIDLLKNSSYVGKMDELIAAVKSGGGTASDVEWDNVKNKPTTIVGYGITDAKIENGTITLGDKTITPLTSAPVTSVNSKTGSVTLSAADVSAIPSTLTGTAGQVLTKTADGQEWKDVDIPDKLPNPNALTFTGAVTGSYDGSEAKTFEIPSGGENGGWELITDITLTEDGGGAFTGVITRNDNGEEFEYRQCMLCISGTVIDGWPSGASQYIYLYGNNAASGGSYTSVALTRLSPGAGGTTYGSTIELSLFGGLLRVIACGGQADTSSLILRGDTQIETFKSIKLSCYGNSQWAVVPYAAGGRIVIYGRK